MPWIVFLRILLRLPLRIKTMSLKVLILMTSLAHRLNLPLLKRGMGYDGMSFSLLCLLLTVLRSIRVELPMIMQKHLKIKPGRTCPEIPDLTGEITQEDLDMILGKKGGQEAEDLGEKLGASGEDTKCLV